MSKNQTPRVMLQIHGYWRYLLTPEIFGYSCKSRTRCWQWNSIDGCDRHFLNKTQRVLPVNLKGQRYDVGDKSSASWKLRLTMPWKHPQVKDDLKQYIIDLGKKLEATEQLQTKRRKRDFILTSFFVVSYITVSFNGFYVFRGSWKSKTVKEPAYHRRDWDTLSGWW